MKYFCSTSKPIIFKAFCLHSTTYLCYVEKRMYFQDIPTEGGQESLTAKQCAILKHALDGMKCLGLDSSNVKNWNPSKLQCPSTCKGNIIFRGSIIHIFWNGIRFPPNFNPLSNSHYLYIISTIPFRVITYLYHSCMYLIVHFQIL